MTPRTLKIFVLEDDPTRIRTFIEELDGNNLTFMDSCTQAKGFEGDYDVVFFDHDLGGRQMEDHEDSGSTFAKMVCHLLGKSVVVIHSYNPDGADRIRQICRKSENPPKAIFLAPFGSPEFKRIVNHYVKV